MLRRLLLVLAILSVATPASAMFFQVQGDQVTMSGDVTGAECQQLQSVLDQTPIHVVVLTGSRGGNANAGYCVGELIRRRGLATVIRGSCDSSCSRMWLGGVSRTLEGPTSRVGLHGNYDSSGALIPSAPARLQAWLPKYAPVNTQLMERWTVLPFNTQMMFFYNDRAELCDHRNCTPMPGWNAQNAGLSTQ